MEIRVDGNRSSAENWMQAQKVSLQLLPELSNEQKIVADKLGISHEAYARSQYAGDLTRNDLAKKAELAAHLIERLAQAKVPGLVVDAVWLKTFDGKFRFELECNHSRALIWINEDLVDELLESGSKTAEEQIARIVEYGLPASWMAKAS